MKKISKSNTSNSHGFSLVEMIVAMGIFAIVAVVALGALIKIMSANKKAQSIQASVTNINFALDAMSREMQLATEFYCADNADFNFTLINTNTNANTNTNTTGCDVDEDTDAVIAFNSYKIVPRTVNSSVDNSCSLIYAYRFRYDVTKEKIVLEKASQKECNESISDKFQSIIDDNVTISGFLVRVSAGDHPLVTLRVSGSAGVREREKTFFDVQTSVATRSAL
ncbi:MAG: type II secretion system GspH family protein [bacterium]|nr:type II secretion system GspH family protein [bacterium]